jgi:hypothetical protein
MDEKGVEMNYCKLTIPPLVVPVVFFEICGGDSTCGILLSYLYRECLNGPKVISFPEMRAATHISQPPTNRARGLLKRIGYITEDNSNQNQKIAYMVDYERVHEEMSRWREDDAYTAPALMMKEQ